MFNYNNFDEVFEFEPEINYDNALRHDIETNRKSLEGLFIDKVLKLLGVKRPQKHYPPKSNSDLRELHKEICAKSVPDHHKLSILFYILIDVDHPTGHREFSTSFEEMAFLPKRYSIFMKGIWHMDRLEFEAALQYLTHPSLTPTFADEILETLARKSKDVSLPLAYYHSVKPSLTNAKSIECLFTSITKASVTEGFFFAREQAIWSHRHMLEMLVALVLQNSPPDQIADRATELVGLPFTAEEEEWFEDYLTKGAGAGLRKAKDTLLMRKIGTGRFHEAVKMKGLNSKSAGGLDWNSLLDGLEKGMGERLYA